MEEKEEMNWKIEGYITARKAVAAAERRGEVGLTGSGQDCRPINMGYFSGCRGWIYKTWDKRYLIPHGEVAEEIMNEFGGQMDI